MGDSIFNDQSLVSQTIRDIALVDIPEFLDATDKNTIFNLALKIAIAFERGDLSFVLKNCDIENEKKLIESFKKNVHLLVQKTWVEKADEEFKEDTIYRINKLCDELILSENKISYRESFSDCFSILYDVVTLLFGNMVKERAFLDYAFRIDPDFGFFWYFVENVEKIINPSEDKARCSILLAMFFLANF